MSEINWAPSADIQTLKQRAVIIAKIRQFFADREVMEVETPRANFEVRGRLRSSPKLTDKIS